MIISHIDEATVKAKQVGDAGFVRSSRSDLGEIATARMRPLC